MGLTRGGTQLSSRHGAQALISMHAACMRHAGGRRWHEGGIWVSPVGRSAVGVAGGPSSSRFLSCGLSRWLSRPLCVWRRAAGPALMDAATVDSNHETFASRLLFPRLARLLEGFDFHLWASVKACGQVQVRAQVRFQFTAQRMGGINTRLTACTGGSIGRGGRAGGRGDGPGPGSVAQMHGWQRGRGRLARRGGFQMRAAHGLRLPLRAHRLGSSAGSFTPQPHTARAVLPNG